jgi:hypothetical protein
MTAVEEVVYAKDQPEYQPLPSIRAPDGTILTRWSLDEDERRQVAEQGYVYLMVMTFNQPLQPLLMTVDPPDDFMPTSIDREQITDIEGQH